MKQTDVKQTTQKPKQAHWSTQLPRDACREAVEWARKQPSYAKAWRTCKRADWLLWLAGHLCKDEATRKTIVLAACACARTALQYVPKGDTRPLKAIETAEAWCRGEATIEQVWEARRDTYAAAAAAAAYAADAAAYAAAAADAADAAAYAAAAADAAAYAADAAASARSKAYEQMAPFLRKYVKRPTLR
jgi:Imm-5 like putative immunity protein